MSTDGYFERQSIIERGQAYLLGGRFYSSVPDDFSLPRDANGRVKPYAVLHLGTIYAAAAGRTLLDEPDQPHVMPFTISCHAPTDQAARDSAGAVRELFIGWTPSPGSESITAPGGSSYRDRDAAGAPTLFVESVALETIINVGDNGDSIPGPGDGPSGATQQATIETIVANLLARQGLNWERFDFPTAVGQWTIPHQLGRVPSVALFDPLGHRMISDELSDAAQVVVTWATPQDGFAILT